MNGFTDEQILQLRSGEALFDSKLNALAQLTLAVAENKGKISEADKEKLLAAGYSEANLIDIIMVIGDKTISNYIHNITNFAIDFPVAPELKLETV